MPNKFEGSELFERTFKHQKIGPNGERVRVDYLFKNKFGDGENENPIEPNRYRIIWMPGCPYANKTVITWKLLGLDEIISLAQTSIYRSPLGWVFGPDETEVSKSIDEINQEYLNGEDYILKNQLTDPLLGKYKTVDPILGIHYLHEVYWKSNPEYVGRSTVPTIVDVKTGKAVNNDHQYIPLYFARDFKKYHKKNAPNLYPKKLEKEIDELNDWILKNINEGAYNAGFATNQKQYEKGYKEFFESLDILEKRLENKRFLFGDYVTLSDIHLYVTLVRFYQTYYQIFGLNKKRLDEYKNLWPYARDLYSIPEFREYTKLDLIKKHYQLSPHLRAKFGNEFGIYALGPDETKWEEVNDRYKLSSSKSIFWEE